MKPGLLFLGGGLLALNGALVVVACKSSSSGDGGNGNVNPSPTTTSTGGGGVDAAATDTIDCGAAPNVTEPFSKAALLGASADCAAWHACTFQNSATALRKSMRAFVADASTKPAAQTAWRDAMTAWSKMELFQYGPIASKATDKYQGRGLKSFVHPWPDLNRCQVETQVVNKGYAQGWNVVLPSSRGLFAIEYALFYDGADTVCLPASTAGQKWAASAPDQLAKDKGEYASTVTENVLSLAVEINNSWSPTGENFKPKLVAGEGYGSDQEALNIVAWSLLYLHTELKDFKIASLAGVSEAPVNSETPFAKIEIENIRTNIEAFRSLFQGCGAGGAGLGFDDWLDAVGAAQLKTDMLAALDRAETAAKAFPSFATATEPQFAELYAAIKPLSDLLKTSFFGSASPLNLRIAPSAASDTD